MNRREFHFEKKPGETPAEERQRLSEMRRFGAEIRKLTGGQDPDIVFEHVGQATFPTSVFVCKRFGRIVICGATAGYNLEFDVRYLWMRQKSIIGSHFCNLYEAERANRLIIEKKIRPVLWKTFPFAETPQAHQIMMANEHRGKLAILVQAEKEELGATA